jgi:hypothetical protein
MSISLESASFPELRAYEQESRVRRKKSHIFSSGIKLPVNKDAAIEPAFPICSVKDTTSRE